jgi:hypothetical protein
MDGGEPSHEEEVHVKASIKTAFNYISKWLRKRRID